MSTMARSKRSIGVPEEKSEKEGKGRKRKEERVRASYICVLGEREGGCEVSEREEWRIRLMNVSTIARLDRIIGVPG